MKFKVHEEIMELFIDQAIFSRGVTVIEIVIEPSTKHSFLHGAKRKGFSDPPLEKAHDEH